MWSVKNMWRARRMKGDVEKAREERQISEQRLEEAQVQVIVPLSALRDQNHITELIRNSFQRKKSTGE